MCNPLCRTDMRVFSVQRELLVSGNDLAPGEKEGNPQVFLGFCVCVSRKAQKSLSQSQ